MINPVSIIALCYAWFFPVLCGFFVLRGLFGKGIRQIPLLLQSALAYMLGIGILPFSMLILGWAGFLFSPVSISMSAIILSLIIAWILRKIFAKDFDVENRSWTGCDLPSDDIVFWVIRIFAVAYIIPISVIIFVRALAVPLIEWDTIATAGFQAKVFFYERSLESHPHIPHPSFPLQIPFLIDWMSLNVGSWEPMLCKIFFPLNFFSGCIVYYYLMKKFLGQTAALLGVILILAAPFPSYQATIAYRDIFFMNYLCAAVGFLFVWFCTENDRFLILSSLFAGLLTFSKLEGLPYAGVYVVLYLWVAVWHGDWKSGLRKIWLVLTPIAAVAGTHMIYKYMNGIPLNEKGGLALHSGMLDRLGIVCGRFWEDIFISADWNAVVFLFFFSLCMSFNQIRTDLKKYFFPFCALVFMLMHFTIALLVSRSTFSDLISMATFPRMILHFFPLMVLGTVFSIFRVCPEGRADAD